MSPENLPLEPTSILSSTPAGSLSIRPPSEDEKNLKALGRVPANVRSMLASLKTAGFIRGLSRTYNLPIDASPQIAFMVFQVATGEVQLNQLSGFIAIKLGVAPQTATKIASEIEKELFAPVALELNAYLKQKQQPFDQAQGKPLPPKLPSVTAGMANVLDLKKKFPQA